jgi:tRNA wybutosine-synthesizing protein 3
MPSLFETKKANILEQLAVPAEEYDDLSPKGSIDEGIRTLIDEINAVDGLVTTSSCAGRTSVFLEGRKKSAPTPEPVDENDVSRAGPGGKGGGGTWLYVSHDPIDFSKRPAEYSFFQDFGLQLLGDSTVQYHEEGRRYIHLKFEPMVMLIPCQRPCSY